MFGFLKTLLASPGKIDTKTKVEIYTWRHCPYCIRAKWLLKKMGVAYTEHAIDGDEEARSKMSQISRGRRSVPQIFFDGQHVGGCDDLHRHYESGRLPFLLNPEEAELSRLEYECGTILLQAVRELHDKGFQKLRACPAQAPSGSAWRLRLVPKEYVDDTGCRPLRNALEEGKIFHYTSAYPITFFKDERHVPLDGASIAYEFQKREEQFLEACRGEDEAYAAHYRALLEKSCGVLPIADSDSYRPLTKWGSHWTGYPKDDDMKVPEMEFPGR